MSRKIEGGGTTFVQGIDYSLSYSSSGVLSVFFDQRRHQSRHDLDFNRLRCRLVRPTARHTTRSDAIKAAIGKTWQVYQAFLRAPTMLLAPYYSYDASVAIALTSATRDAGGGRLAMAYVDVPIARL